MFLPGEPLFNIALQKDPTLFEFAVDQRVIPASPLTLVALLRTIAIGLAAAAINRERRGDSGARPRSYTSGCDDGGCMFRRSAPRSSAPGRSYDDFVGSLDARVMVSARRFSELGVNAAKELPDTLPPASTSKPASHERAELRVPTQESLIEADIVRSDGAARAYLIARRHRDSSADLELAGRHGRHRRLGHHRLTRHHHRTGLRCHHSLLFDLDHAIDVHASTCSRRVGSPSCVRNRFSQRVTLRGRRDP